MDNMRDNVHELWVIEGRPDLEDDCLQYCYDNIDRPVPITMIEFLSHIVVKLCLPKTMSLHRKNIEKTCS